MKVVHLHSAVQVVDGDRIVYTPKKNDVIVRHVPDGVVKLDIPGLADDSSPAVFDLLPGDKIVSESDKIKLRVDSNHFRSMSLPSLVTIYTSESNKLKRLQRITLLQQSILCVSNNYIVTLSERQNDCTCHVYQQSNGRAIPPKRKVIIATISLHATVAYG